MTPSGRVYSTRHRSRQVDKEARYDDIFSAVTRAVQDESEFGGISRRLIEENSMPSRMRLFSQSSHSESSSEEDEEVQQEQGSQDPQPSSSSGRPQRRAALRAHKKFGAVETIEEASDDAFERMLSTHAATYAARVAKGKVAEEKRKAQEAVRRTVRALEKERATREERQRFACTLCPLFFERHLQLHKHLIENHSGAGCPSCKQCSRILRQRHECFKCGQFAANVKTHLVEAHYAVSTRRGAVLECTRCSRTFDQLEEVLAHEKRDHGVLHRAHAKKHAFPKVAVRRAGGASGGGGGVQFHCRVCGDGFDTRYVRDQHLTKHFQSVLESVWVNVERMQEERPDEYQLNQCPLCGAVMSSRKSFRTHIIHRHLIHDRRALDLLVGPGPGVKQDELLMVREHIALEGRKNNAEPVELPALPGVVKEEEEKEEGTSQPLQHQQHEEEEKQQQASSSSSQ